jgi:hypothetical protein
MKDGWFGGGRVHPTTVFSPAIAHLAVFPPAIVSLCKNQNGVRDAQLRIDEPAAKQQDDLKQPLYVLFLSLDPRTFSIFLPKIAQRNRL